MREDSRQVLELAPEGVHLRDRPFDPHRFTDVNATMTCERAARVAIFEWQLPGKGPVSEGCRSGCRERDAGDSATAESVRQDCCGGGQTGPPLNFANVS